MPGYNDLMEETGNIAAARGGAAPKVDPYSSAGAERRGSQAYRQRALELYGQLDAIKQQYGQAAELPDQIIDQIHNLHTHLNHAMNEWEQYKNRSRSNTQHEMAAQSGLQELGAMGSVLRGGGNQAPGAGPQGIADELEQRANGIRPMTPAPKQAMPPAGQPQPRGRRAVPPGQPQFGSSGGKMYGQHGGF